jgi:hypothetical protein
MTDSILSKLMDIVPQGQLIEHFCTAKRIFYDKDVDIIELLNKWMDCPIGNKISRLTNTTGMDICSLRDLVSVNKGRYGNGVFANEDIPVGKIVTMYPIHMHIKKQANKSATECYGKENCFNMDYVYHLNDKISYQGNPERQEKGWLGHFVNDAYPYVKDLKNGDGKEQVKYLIYSSSCSNCKFEISGDWIYLRSTTIIKSGSELFAPYGVAYWVKSPKEESNKQLTNYIKTLSENQQQYVKELILKLAYFQI